MRRILLPIVLLALAGTPGGAEARQSDLLWATINICDSPRYPNMMGVRASMPGNGTRQRMYMRFNAWWYSRDRDEWLRIAGARSPWIRVGSARFRTRQGGYTFKLSPPPNGKSFVVRGVVEMQWRERRVRRRRARWAVAKRVRATTRQGVSGVDEGDPPGLSLGICEIF